MRSSELAELAGVSVRTLRHYHRVGILPEPERTANGYRSYAMSDLIRLLRIRRLAALGIPLDEMTSLLEQSSADDGAEPGTRLLDELDAELTGRIERLQSQRDLVRQVRHTAGALDAPPELAPFLNAFATALPTDLARVDLEQAVLLAHLVGSQGMPGLTRFYAATSDPPAVTALAELTRRFAALDDSSPDGETEALIAGYVRFLEPTLAALADVRFATDEATATHLLAAYMGETLNATQRGVLSTLAERLSAATNGGDA